MDRLFDNTADETIMAMVAQPLLASGAAISALITFGYREMAVRLWPKEKADLVLKKCKMEERIARNRALGAAKLIDDKDGVGKRGQVSSLERLDAATQLEWAKGGGPDEILQTMMYTLYVCSDDELKRLAGYLGRLWTAPPPPPEPAEEYGYADDGAGPDPGGTESTQASGGGDAGGAADFGFVYTPDEPY